MTGPDALSAPVPSNGKPDPAAPGAADGLVAHYSEIKVHTVAQLRADRGRSDRDSRAECRGILAVEHGTDGRGVPLTARGGGHSISGQPGRDGTQ